MTAPTPDDSTYRAAKVVFPVYLRDTPGGRLLVPADQSFIASTGASPVIAAVTSGMPDS